MVRRTYIIIFLCLLCIGIITVHTGFSADKQESRKGGYIVTYPSIPYKESIRDKLDMVPEYTERGRDDTRAQEPVRVIPPTEDETALAVKEQVINSFKKQLAMKNKQIDILKERLDRVTKNLHERENELFTMRPQKQMNVYEVRRGDSLWKIAARKDTYGNPYMWIKIYNSNVSKIQDPNLIYQGQLFDIP